MSTSILEHISHFLPMIAVASAVYFLLIRPQQKKAQDHTNLLSQLKHNDYVMTTGGLWGHVQKVTETKVFLKIHKDVVVEVEKTSIITVQCSHEKSPAQEAVPSVEKTRVLKSSEGKKVGQQKKRSAEKKI